VNGSADPDLVGTQIGTLSRDVAVLTARYETINGKLAGLDAKFDALVGEIGRSRQTPWPLIISGLMAAMVMVGGGWALVDLQTRLTVAQQTTPLASAAAHTETALAEIAARVSRLSDGQQKLGERTTAQESALTEIESQFKSMDNTASLMRSTELRTLGLLWEKVYGQRMPEFFFAPSIARSPS